MKKISKTEEQIIEILREAEAGVKVDMLCRRHSMSSPTFYAWKAKFGGMDVSDAKRLRALDEENRQLKSMVTKQALDNRMLRALAEKDGDFCGSPPSYMLAAEAIWRKRTTCVQHNRQREVHAAILQSTAERYQVPRAATGHRA